MSLRTKLLAAVIGLPVAIVLLALLMLMRSEGRDYTPPRALEQSVREMLGEWEAASDVGRSGDASKEPLRRHKKALRDLFDRVLQLQSNGRFSEAYIVLMPRPAVADETYSYSTLASYIAIADGAMSSEANPHVIDPETQIQLREWAQRAFRDGFRFRDDHVAWAGRLKVEERHYVLVATTHDRRAAMRRVYWILIASALALAALSYWLVSRWVITPLNQLSTAASRIAEGNYGVGVDPGPRDDEFGQTLRALEHMAGEISEYQGHLEDRVMSALGRMKKAEKHLTVAQRLAATGKLAAGLAHEINNPLGGMQNAVRALKRGDLDEEKTGVYLGLVDEGLSRVEQTVKKFLSFSPRRVDARACDLSDVVAKALALAAHRAQSGRIHVTRSLPEPGQAIVFGDPNELQQVALNLFLNAADAVSDRREPTIQVTVESREDEVVLRVEDNGVGMSEEDQVRCFDMFFTSKVVGEGTGMGLAVVHTIITNHGGRIELRSQLEVGTNFQVILPKEPGPE